MHDLNYIRYANEMRARELKEEKEAKEREKNEKFKALDRAVDNTE